ncbi:MAG TPA: ArsR family transcriptional regulator [Methanocorpusculum sp.]|nr:ArsR family transcriptional regulator [Methanocorpusculum sp.]
MPEADSRQPLRIYSNDGEVTTVRSPVRNEILQLLAREGETSFARILEVTKLSKSTVSGYLSSLVEAGLVLEVPAPDDARRKNYILHAVFLGDMVPATYSGASEFRELIRQMHTKSDKVDYRDILPHIIKIALAEAGIQINPVLRRGGMILGEAVASYVVADTLEKTLANIAEFWERYQFGNMKTASLEPLKIDVYNCYECALMPKEVKSSCIISVGILTALLSAFYGKEVLVQEVRCISNGDPCCCFAVTV